MSFYLPRCSHVKYLFSAWLKARDQRSVWSIATRASCELSSASDDEADWNPSSSLSSSMDIFCRKMRSFYYFFSSLLLTSSFSWKVNIHRSWSGLFCVNSKRVFCDGMIRHNILFWSRFHYNNERISKRKIKGRFGVRDLLCSEYLIDMFDWVCRLIVD